MNTQPDFEELLRLFQENKIAYTAVGGYAVAFRSNPRQNIDQGLHATENPFHLLTALVP